MFSRNTALLLAGLTLFTVHRIPAQYGTLSSRGLLEKTIYYIDENGKTGTCSFWSLYLGKFSCKLTKTFPGEGDVSFDAEVNYNFLSSLYIEGKGFSKRGKVDADAKFGIINGETVTPIDPENIIYVYDYGAKVKTSDGATADLVLISQDNTLYIKRLLLRMFKYDKVEKDLKADGDVAIKAFAFTKKDATEAMSQK